MRFLEPPQLALFYSIRSSTRDVVNGSCLGVNHGILVEDTVVGYDDFGRKEDGHHGSIMGRLLSWGM